MRFALPTGTLRKIERRPSREAPFPPGNQTIWAAAETGHPRILLPGSDTHALTRLLVTAQTREYTVELIADQILAINSFPLRMEQISRWMAGFVGLDFLVALAFFEDGEVPVLDLAGLIRFLRARATGPAPFSI